MAKLGYERPLYLVAFDHRSSFAKGLFGVPEPVPPETRAKISDTKDVIFEGFQQAIILGAPRDLCGVLVDERFGSAVARRAKTAGFLLAMPVERSGQEEFEFEYGEEFGRHIEDFDPHFSKVLVRYDAEGDRDLNRRQAEKLARLSTWLHARDRRFLFELLVPDRPGRRAALIVEALRELQAGGVEPDIWKVEGLDTSADCARVVEQARAGTGRDRVVCIVLGRGASMERVLAWLKAAAPVIGFVGFAVGRTEWLEALEGYVAGTRSREETSRGIADRYLRMIRAYVEYAKGGGDEAGDGGARPNGVQHGRPAPPRGP
jgi:myo-inositol catabolism protein IolC